MGRYLVRAKPRPDLLPGLKARLDAGEISRMRPFGAALDYSLKNGKVQRDGFFVWEEEDYCSPPLAQERQEVLDRYFTDLKVERVVEGQGWEAIKNLSSMWAKQEGPHPKKG